jgi:nitrite reductase/ring-hydroxylating ferredoxin subunit
MAEWVTVAIAGAVSEGEMVPVSAGGKHFAIYCVDGRLYATDNLCTHGLAFLTDGFLEGLEVECPLHGGRFEISTGKGQGEPITCDIKAYNVRTESTEIQVQLETTERENGS